MKHIIFIILLFGAFYSANSQNVKRAYKSLEKLEYDKANEAFEKILLDNSQNVAANFGIALIKADDKSPLFDIVGAWKYIETIRGHENELTQEEIEIIGEYFMNTEVRKTSRPVKKKIEIAEDAVEARLIKYIREENNLEAVYRVLELYPNYKHRDNVIHIRNQFEFRKYEKLNTLAGYLEFIQKFPDAAQVPKAIKYRDKLAFDEIKTKNTVAGYNEYIAKYPSSVYLQQASKLRNAAAYTEAKNLNTLEAYQKFIKSYPNALEIADARKQEHQLMYEKAKRIKTLEAYNEFIRNYPDGNYYIDVFNLKATDLGMKDFRQLNFESPDFKWAKTLDNNEQKENARSIALTKDGGFIIAGTTKTNNETSYTDSWIIKLDNQGKMVWNKTIGQPFNDDVIKVMVNSTNEAIVLGYTQATSDSNSFTGWMFKIGPDGKKLWNKKLGNYTIASCAIDNNDKIYIASYVNDTIPDNYYIQIFNNEGQKTGERDYVQKGTFNDILFTSNGNSFLAGTRWINYTDPKFYIIWEDTLTMPGEILKADFNNQNIAVLASDNSNRYQMLYSVAGNKIWKNSTIKSDSTEAISDILLTNKSELIVLGQNELNSFAVKYDIKGSLLKEKQISGKYHFVEAIKNNLGETTYLLSGDDYLIISFSSDGL